MANIEYFDDKMKTERVAVQARAATGAEIQPESLMRADHGIPVDLGATTFELLMKIGFVGYPSPGHLNATTAVARRLQSRGHEVVFI